MNKKISYNNNIVNNKFAALLIIELDIKLNNNPLKLFVKLYLKLSLTSLYSTALIQGVTKSRKQDSITPISIFFFNYKSPFLDNHP